MGSLPLAGAIEAVPGGYVVRAENGTHRSDLYAATAAGYNRLDLVLETYGVKTCANYPAGAMRFEALRTLDSRGAFTPAWVREPYIDKYPGTH